MKNDYKIIFFDVDDTILDHGNSEQKSLQTIHEMFYSKIPYEEFQATFKTINSALWKRVGATESPLKPSEVRLLRFEQLNEQFSFKLPAQLIATAYEQALGEKANWLPGAEDTLEFLSNHYTLGAITNGLTNVQTTKRERLELDRFFSCFIISDSVGYEKPHPQMFNFALKSLSCSNHSKKNMLMVGDSLESDGKAANNFGIDFCFINRNAIGLETAKVPVQYNLETVADLPIQLGLSQEYESFLSFKRIPSPATASASFFYASMDKPRDFLPTTQAKL